MPDAMALAVAEEGPERLEAYASIPIAFEVTEVLHVDSPPTVQGLAPLISRPVERPYVKDYDAYAGNGPLGWATRFRLDGWGILAARIQGQRVGGAVVIARDSEIDRLERRDDVALLWDLRVAPSFRRRGVASTLLGAAERWAVARGCRIIEVETQHVNVPACRFYARRGFALREVNDGAYDEMPDEIQIIWDKRLALAFGPVAGSADLR